MIAQVSGQYGDRLSTSMLEQLYNKRVLPSVEPALNMLQS